MHAHARNDVSDKGKNREHNQDERRDQDARENSQQASGFDEDVVALDAHLKRLQRNHGGQRQCISGSNVERSAVARADDSVTFELALIERAPVVRAHVLDRINRTVDVAEQNLD